MLQSVRCPKCGNEARNSGGQIVCRVCGEKGLPYTEAGSIPVQSPPAAPVPCPHCGTALAISTSLVGQMVQCPSCHGQFQAAPSPPPVPSLSSQEVILQNDEITVAQLLDFIRNLPDQTVTRRFSDGTEDTYPLGKFRAELQTFDPAAILYSPNYFFILQRARTKHGWLCLEYGCAFAYLATKIVRSELPVASDPDAQALVYAFREIEARTQMGIGCQEYCQLVASNSLRLRDFVDLKSATFPLFSALLNGIFTNYCNAASMWQQGAGGVPIQFSGGGFGLKGAAQGMAIGLGLNALVGAVNKSKQNSLNDRLIAEWAVASRKIRIGEQIMRTAKQV